MVDPHRAVPSAAVLGTVQADWGQGSQIELPQIRTLVKALTSCWTTSGTLLFTLFQSLHRQIY